MKFIFEFMGCQYINRKACILALIRASGTTGNIVLDQDQMFTFSAYIEDGVIIDFKPLGNIKDFGLTHRSCFKMNAYTCGYVDIVEEQFEDICPGVPSELMRSASEGKLFHMIKYSGN